MDGLLQRKMNGIRAVLTGPELATGLLLAALMVVVVGRVGLPAGSGRRRGGDT